MMGLILHILFLLQAPVLSPLSNGRSTELTGIFTPTAGQTVSDAGARLIPYITREGELYHHVLRDSLGKLRLDAYSLDASLQKPHGPMTLFFADGSRQINPYHQGRLEGVSEKYFANGQLEEQTHFTHGRRNGTYSRFYANGSLHTTGYFQDDQATGSWKKYYANGRPMSVSEYVVDDLISIRYYTRNGDLIEEKPSGLLDRIQMVFFDDHLEKEIELKYATYYGTAERIAGGHFAFTLYTMEGVKAARVQFTDGSLRNKSGPFQRFDASGNLRLLSGYRDNQLYGPFLRWYSNGRMSDSGRVAKGRQEGTWISWYPDGSLRDSGSYIRGQRDGLWTVREKASGARSIGLYREGVRYGEWKFYSPSGKIQYIRKYKGGWRYGASETIGIGDDF